MPESKKNFSTESWREHRLRQEHEAGSSILQVGGTPASLCLGMGCPGRKTLSFFLIFVLVYLHGALPQEAGPTGQRKPFFERLRRLEEQVNVDFFFFN